jgi:hypothetical protein
MLHSQQAENVFANQPQKKTVFKGKKNSQKAIHISQNIS